MENAPIPLEGQFPLALRSHPQRAVGQCPDRVRYCCKTILNAPRRVKVHMFTTGTPDPGAGGKDYRANSVHAPFPENQHLSAPLRERVVRRLPAQTSLAM
jgi:hypothetical protein